jgi:glutamyl-tRNA reductase
MVDLAVPRDIEPEVAELDDVFLYTVDDLAEIVQQGVGNRQQAAIEAEDIITIRVESFMQWLETRESVPTIRALRDHAEKLRRDEVEKALKALSQGETPQQVLEQLSNALTNKLLHAPSHALNNISGEQRASVETMLRQLYQIKN